MNESLDPALKKRAQSIVSYLRDELNEALNRGAEEAIFQLSPKTVGINRKSRLRDLWQHKELGAIGSGRKFSIPKHGIIVLKID